jgi:hypothetical protein
VDDKSSNDAVVQAENVVRLKNEDKGGERDEACSQEQSDRTKNSTRQLYELIVIMWLCKCECRTHRESCLSNNQF